MVSASRLFVFFVLSTVFLLPFVSAVPSQGYTLSACGFVTGDGLACDAQALYECTISSTWADQPEITSGLIRTTNADGETVDYALSLVSGNSTFGVWRASIDLDSTTRTSEVEYLYVYDAYAGYYKQMSPEDLLESGIVNRGGCIVDLRNPLVPGIANPSCSWTQSAYSQSYTSGCLCTESITTTKYANDTCRTEHVFSGCVDQSDYETTSWCDYCQTQWVPTYGSCQVNPQNFEGLFGTTWLVGSEGLEGDHDVLLGVSKKTYVVAPNDQCYNRVGASLEDRTPPADNNLEVVCRVDKSYGYGRTTESSGYDAIADPARKYVAVETAGSFAAENVVVEPLLIPTLPFRCNNESVSCDLIEVETTSPTKLVVFKDGGLIQVLDADTSSVLDSVTVASAEWHPGVAVFGSMSTLSDVGEYLYFTENSGFAVVGDVAGVATLYAFNVHQETGDLSLNVSVPFSSLFSSGVSNRNGVACAFSLCAVTDREGDSIGIVNLDDGTSTTVNEVPWPIETPRSDVDYIVPVVVVKDEVPVAFLWQNTVNLSTTTMRVDTHVVTFEGDSSARDLNSAYSVLGDPATFSIGKPIVERLSGDNVRVFNTLKTDMGDEIAVFQVTADLDASVCATPSTYSGLIVWVASKVFSLDVSGFTSAIRRSFISPLASPVMLCYDSIDLGTATGEWVIPTTGSDDAPQCISSPVFAKCSPSGEGRDVVVASYHVAAGYGGGDGVVISKAAQPATFAGERIVDDFLPSPSSPSYFDSIACASNKCMQYTHGVPGTLRYSEDGGASWDAVTWLANQPSQGYANVGAFEGNVYVTFVNATGLLNLFKYDQSNDVLVQVGSAVDAGDGSSITLPVQIYSARCALDGCVLAGSLGGGGLLTNVTFFDAAGFVQYPALADVVTSGVRLCDDGTKCDAYITAATTLRRYNSTTETWNIVETVSANDYVTALNKDVGNNVYYIKGWEVPSASTYCIPSTSVALYKSGGWEIEGSSIATRHNCDSFVMRRTPTGLTTQTSFKEIVTAGSLGGGQLSSGHAADLFYAGVDVGGKVVMARPVGVLGYADQFANTPLNVSSSVSVLVLGAGLLGSSNNVLTFPVLTSSTNHNYGGACSALSSSCNPLLWVGTTGATDTFSALDADTQSSYVIQRSNGTDYRELVRYVVTGSDGLGNEIIQGANQQDYVEVGCYDNDDLSVKISSFYQPASACVNDIKAFSRLGLSSKLFTDGQLDAIAMPGGIYEFPYGASLINETLPTDVKTTILVADVNSDTFVDFFGLTETSITKIVSSPSPFTVVKTNDLEYGVKCDVASNGLITVTPYKLQAKNPKAVVFDVKARTSTFGFIDGGTVYDQGFVSTDAGVLGQVKFFPPTTGDFRIETSLKDLVSGEVSLESCPVISVPTIAKPNITQSSPLNLSCGLGDAGELNWFGSLGQGAADKGWKYTGAIAPSLDGKTAYLNAVTGVVSLSHSLSCEGKVMNISFKVQGYSSSSSQTDAWAFDVSADVKGGLPVTLHRIEVDDGILQVRSATKGINNQVPLMTYVRATNYTVDSIINIVDKTVVVYVNGVAKYSGDMLYLGDATLNKIDGVSFTQVDGFGFLDYVRTSVLEAKDGGVNVAPQFILSQCDDGQRDFSSNGRPAGCNVPGDKLCRNSTVTNTYQHVEAWCKEQAAVGGKCNSEELQDVIDKYPKCYNEAYTYCVAVSLNDTDTEQGSGFQSMTSCSLQLQSSHIANNIIAPTTKTLWSLIWKNIIVVVVVILVLVLLGLAGRRR
jgi:hypothetical protein